MALKQPTNRIYIGETCDIKTRFMYYRNLQCKNQAISKCCNNKIKTVSRFIWN